MTRPVSDAASNSHPVAAHIGRTNIPLASGEGSGGRDHTAETSSENRPCANAKGYCRDGPNGTRNGGGAVLPNP
jgi:hypothetical protein